MKNIFFILSIILFFSFNLTAQVVPAGMKYQAVARDLNGQVLADKTIGVQVSLVTENTKDQFKYIETHRIVTNKLGLFTLTIGEGEVVKGAFAQIPWSKEQIWIELSIDDQGGDDFVLVHSGRLLAVPYAFHAGTAEALATENGGLKSGGSPWQLKGNSGTSPNDHFVGTIDPTALVFRTASIERMRISADGIVNIQNTVIGNSQTGTAQVDVLSIGEVQSDLNVDGNVQVTGSSQFDNNVVIEQNLNVLASALVENELFAKDGFIGNNLAVNVDTETGNNLTVGNDAMVGHDLEVVNDGRIMENLTVGKDVGIGRDLTVDNRAEVEATLRVGGATTLENTLNVAQTVNLNSSGGTTTIGGATTIKSPLTNESTSTLKGQVTVDVSGLSNADDDYNNYPLRVEGSNQGIAIKVNANNPDTDNNFVTFFDNSGNAVGRVEGQLKSDLITSPEYIVDVLILTADVIAKTAGTVLSLQPNTCAGTGAVACPPEPSVIAIAIVDLALAAANLISYREFKDANLGVTFESGSADYAEWLERKNYSEKIMPGDIVGVNGGKISKNTSNVNQYLVASTNPAVLGNMPIKGEENNFEKIAFMGQIPVKVLGQVNIGDYIIPSGLNDGSGIGVSPNRITASQYESIVGIAWTATSAGSMYSMVNMSIGLNSNDVAKLVVTQEVRIEKLEKDLNSLEQRLLALESGSSPIVNPPLINDLIVEENMVAFDYSSQFDVEAIDEAILLLEETYRTKGIDIENNPNLNRIFNDQEFRQEVIRLVLTDYEKNMMDLMKNTK